MTGLSEKPFSHAEYLKRLADTASQEGRREQCVALIAALYRCFGGDLASPVAHRGILGINPMMMDIDEAEEVSG